MLRSIFSTLRSEKAALLQGGLSFSVDLRGL
jgi:hypothetical protein